MQTEQKPTPLPSAMRVESSTIVVLMGALTAALVLIPFAVTGSNLARILLVLPFVVATVAVFDHSPELGFPLAIVIALLVPFSVGTGTETGVNASVIFAIFLVGMWFLHMFVRQGQISLVNSATVPSLLAWSAISVLAFGFGQLDWFPINQAPITAQLGGLAIFILLPGLFLVALHRIRSLLPIKWMTWLLLTIGAVFVVGLVSPLDTRSLGRVFTRAVFDSMFWTWISAMAFSQALINEDLNKGLRLLIGTVGAGAFFFTMVVRQSWISGWFPSLIAIIVILGLLKPKWVLVSAAIALPTFLLIPGLLEQVFLGGDNAYSLLTRLEAWGIVFDLVQHNPVLGLGPSNYYNYTVMRPILGYSVSFNSHNNYIDVLAQTGVLGLSCLLWFFVALGRELWQLRTKVPSGFPRAFAVGAIGGFAATVVAGALGDWVLPFVYNVGLEGFRASSIAWLMLGAAVSLHQLYPERDA